MNNIFCHIVGLDDNTKNKLIDFLENKDYNHKIIDLNEITEKIIEEEELDMIYREYQTNLEKSKDYELKTEFTKKYKQNEKEMNQYWKDKFEIYLEEELATDKKNILIGLSNHFKNTRVNVKIDCKMKFFVDIDCQKNAQNVIKKNLDNFRDEIILGNFPLEYLDTNFLIKKRQNVRKIYKKKGYSHKNIKYIIDTILINLKSEYEFNQINNLYIASKNNYNNKIEEYDNIYAYIIPWIALISYEKLNNIIKSYNKKGGGRVEEKIEGSFDQLNTNCFLYEVQKDDFYFYNKGKGLKLITNKNIVIIKKFNITNILDYLKENDIVTIFKK